MATANVHAVRAVARGGGKGALSPRKLSAPLILPLVPQWFALPASFFNHCSAHFRSQECTRMQDFVSKIYKFFGGRDFPAGAGTPPAPTPCPHAQCWCRCASSRLATALPTASRHQKLLHNFFTSLIELRSSGN